MKKLQCVLALLLFFFFGVVIWYQYIQSFLPFNSFISPKQLVLVVYVFRENNQGKSYINQNNQRKENLAHFVEYGMRINDPQTDYLFVVPGPPKIHIPKSRNIGIIFQDPSDTTDLQHYIEGLRVSGAFTIGMKSPYKYFFLVSSSLKGPIPSPVI
jgi:hypothetical protein